MSAFTQLHSTLICAFLGVSSTVLFGQEVLHHWPGYQTSGFFPGSVSQAGDVNQDGLPDVLVGDNINSVYLYSGGSGDLIRSYVGEGTSGRFGESVAAIPDEDGDGVSDHLIGAPVDGPSPTGRAYLYSGRTGILITFFEGENSPDYFGIAVAPLGDLDADGTPDLGISATAAHSKGAVYLYSGKTLQLIRRDDPPGYGGSFGAAISKLGDVDRDGHDDYIAGWPSIYNVSEAFVISGKTGAYLHRFRHDYYYRFGEALSDLEDVDGDGINDLIIGAVWWWSSYVYSGASGALIKEIPPLDLASCSCEVGRTGDFNHDGADEFFVGDPRANANGLSDSGRVAVYCGATLDLLYAYEGGVAYGYLGYPVSSAGDFNLDGIPDLLVGATGTDVGGKRGAGCLYVYSGLHPPQVLSITPNRTRYDSTATVTLKGDHLSTNSNVSVEFGGLLASNVVVVDDETIICDAPPQPPSVVDVVFRSPIGTATLEEGFAYTPALELDGDPAPGAAVTLRLLLEVGDDVFAILGAPPPKDISTPPFQGALCVAPFALLSFLVDSPSQELAWTFSIPGDPALSGVTALIQALVGPTFTGDPPDAIWTQCLAVTIL